MKRPSFPLIDKVERCLKRLGLEETGMVAAVSGGPDSVALLHALLRLRSASSPPLVIAHLNHQLRGADSDADEAFVRGLYASLSVNHPRLILCCERVDVAAVARDAKANLEETARRLRYGWLERVAREHGLGLVATGHTADDQAETVLHRLLRGTGLRGLRGIAERRPLAAGVEVVRPLLDVTRAEVLAFLEELGQPARQDHSNADLRFTRNRIRLELLPQLAAYNPAIREVLARLARQAEEAHEEEQTLAGVLLAEAERPRAGPLLIFDHGCLAAASRYWVRLVFRLVWEREGWPTGGMSFEHWRRLEAIVFDGAAAVDFPGGVRARRHRRVVQIGAIR